MTAILDGVDSNHGYVCVFLLLNCLGGIIVFKALKRDFPRCFGNFGKNV